MNTAEIPYAIVLPQETPQEILDSFGDALVGTMGVDDAMNTLVYLTKLMKDNPAFVRKMLKADRWVKFSELIHRREVDKGGKRGFDVMDIAYFGQMKAIFSDLL